MANPSTYHVPSDPGVLYALSSCLVERCRKADEPLLQAAVIYADRLPAEFSVLTIRDLAAINRRVLEVPQAGVWLRKHRHLFLAEGR